MKRTFGFSLVLSVILIMALFSPVLGDDGGGNGDGEPIVDGGGNGDHGPEPTFPGGTTVGNITAITNPEGIPIVDEYGQPVIGQPLIDENGNPITGPNGDPLYSINGQVVEIRSGQTIINISDPGEGDTEPGEGDILISDPVYITNPDGIPVVDEYGQPVMGQPLIDENGNPITGPNGDPLYSINGRVVEVRSGQTIISIFDLIRDSESDTSSSEGDTSSSGGGQSQGPPPQVEVPRGLSEKIITYTRPIEFDWPARHTILSDPIPM